MIDWSVGGAFTQLLRTKKTPWWYSDDKTEPLSCHRHTPALSATYLANPLIEVHSIVRRDAEGFVVMSWNAKGLIMVPRSRNARGLQTPYVLADPPCVHRKGLTCASQKL